MLFVAIGTWVGTSAGLDRTLIYYEVTRGVLPIVITERGNLESQNNVKVYCEVDDVDGDGISGTPILSIVPNGTSVKEGDLLVELDAANHQERLDRQILDTEKARAEQIKAKAKYDNQITQNKTLEADAELKVQLAELELQMFEDRDKGTHKLEVEEIKREIEDINNDILAAQASLKLKKNDKLGIESLFKLGYAGKSELERTRLDYLQAESAYAAKLNKLTTQLATLDKKEDYEKRMQVLKFQGAFDTSKRNLQQVIRDNKALLDQATAATEAADEALKKEEELLQRYRQQVAKCEIRAPQDGMVAYSDSEHHWYAKVQQGAPMRPRQHILSLPYLKKMQVKTAVHESVLDEVSEGLPATVRIDAFPNRSYKGSVKSVAVLPDQGGRMGSDTKVYETIVTIDEEVEQLKPGMSAVVEIHVHRLTDVLSVPVQAVVQIEKDNWCYADCRGAPERRPLTLGRTNDKFVEIRKGLAEGDRVVLNPMALVDETAQGESATSPEEEPEATTEEDRQQTPRSRMQEGVESPRPGGSRPSKELRQRP